MTDEYASSHLFGLGLATAQEVAPALHEGRTCYSFDLVEIMICLPNAHTPLDKPRFTGSLYMRLDDVDTLWQRVKDATTVVYPLENFHYGMREFAIRDNNGYCLQFGSEIKDPSQIPPPEQD